MNTSMTKADKYFSLYIRQKEAVNGYCRCITCGRLFPWNRIDCGHFMSRRYQATRYDEKNCAPQCAACNRFNQGQQFKFGLMIDLKHGEGTAESLLMKSKMTCKRDRFDYEAIAEMYKTKLHELDNTKN